MRSYSTDHFGLWALGLYFVLLYFLYLCNRGDHKGSFLGGELGRRCMCMLWNCGAKVLNVFEERVCSFIRTLKWYMKPKKLRAAILETWWCGITWKAFQERTLFFPASVRVMTTTHLREIECSLWFLRLEADDQALY